MAFPTQGVLDAFNRADEDPLSNGGKWTSQVLNWGDSLALVGNAATGGSAAGGASTWNVSPLGPDIEVYATIAAKAGTDKVMELDLGFDATDSATLDGYTVYFYDRAGTDQFQIRRYDNGTTTQLGSTISQEFAVGDLVGLCRTGGTTIEAWYKSGAGAWTSLGSQPDSTYTANGYIAAGVEGTTGRLDNFGGGTVGAPLGAIIDYSAFPKQLIAERAQGVS